MKKVEAVLVLHCVWDREHLRLSSFLYLDFVSHSGYPPNQMRTEPHESAEKQSNCA